MKKLFFLTFLSFIFGLGFAQQNILPAQNLRVHLNVAPSVSRLLREIPPDSVSSVMGNLPFDCTYIVSLSDTVNIDSIEVKLGSSVGSNDLFAKTFEFDGASTNSDGTTYTRSGNTVRLYLGSFSGLNTYVAEVRLKDGAGNLSGPVRVIR